MLSDKTSLYTDIDANTRRLHAFPNDDQGEYLFVILRIWVINCIPVRKATRVHWGFVFLSALSGINNEYNRGVNATDKRREGSLKMCIENTTNFLAILRSIIATCAKHPLRFKGVVPSFYNVLVDVIQKDALLPWKYEILDSWSRLLVELSSIRDYHAQLLPPVFTGASSLFVLDFHPRLIICRRYCICIHWGPVFRDFGENFEICRSYFRSYWCLSIWYLTFCEEPCWKLFARAIWVRTL